MYFKQDWCVKYKQNDTSLFCSGFFYHKQAKQLVVLQVIAGTDICGSAGLCYEATKVTLLSPILLIMLALEFVAFLLKAADFVCQM